MLSAYLLTHNSARRLDQVLAAIQDIADEIVIVDSGSSDATRAIAERHGARFVFRRFDTFTLQREFAVSQCSHEWVLSLDSDEVASPALREVLLSLKAAGFRRGGMLPDAYAIRREWYFLGHHVHCFYPSQCPDQPVRLFQRDKAAYIPGRHVHEGMTGFAQALPIEEPLLHYTCDSVDDLYSKLNQYSTLAARDLVAQKVSPGWGKVIIMPILVAAQWYFLRGGWRDGLVGLVHARFVQDMVYQKYLKLKLDLQTQDAG
ncbi:MAG TPA: glycosyltransferase family 2 protein [Acetobacteraceae bacterium]|nr:glycosyltransferase family 2 protein [Acetobacteraceae bacterium]